MLRVNGNLDISNLSNVKAYNITINSNNTINIPKLDKQNIHQNLLTQMQEVGASGLIYFESSNIIKVTGNCKLSNLVMISNDYDINIDFGGYDFQTENVHIISNAIIFQGSGNVDLQKGSINGTIIGVGIPGTTPLYLGVQNGNMKILGSFSVNIGGSLDATRRLEEAKLRAARELTQQQNEFYTAKQSAYTQKNAFEQISSSLHSLVSAKGAAEKEAKQALETLNSTIIRLNKVKAENLKLRALKLVEINYGNDNTNITYDAAQFIYTDIPLHSFTEAANPNYSHAQSSGANVISQLNSLNPNTQDMSSLQSAKSQAINFTAQIMAYKQTLQQAANSLHNAKAQADAKTQEFKSANNAQEFFLKSEQQTLEREKSVIKLLILDKINESDLNQETSIVKGFKQGNIIAIEYILTKIETKEIESYFLNLQDNDGKTALHYAISKKMFSEAKLMIHNNANPYIPDDHGNTAYSMAYADNNSELFLLMVEKFGPPPAKETPGLNFENIETAIESAEIDDDKSSIISGFSQDLVLSGDYE